MRDELRAPGLARSAAAIGKVTFLEILRERVLYNVLLCAGFLFGIAYLASRLTGSVEGRVLVDFGVSALDLSCSMLAVLVGSGLLGREFERRTAQMVLSRPVSHLAFVSGKYLGLAAVVALNWALASGVLAAMAPGSLGATAAWALGLQLAQSLVLAGIALFVSSFATTGLAVIASIGLYLIGNNLSQLRALAAKPGGSWLEGWLLRLASAALPDLERFRLGTRVTYGLPVSAAEGAATVGYAAILIALSLVAAGLALRGKER